MNFVSVILDTNIYLDLWAYNKHQEKLEWASRRYLARQSSVVLHELRRGIKTKRGLLFVENLVSLSPQIFNPSYEDWWKGAEIISHLSKKYKWNRQQRMHLQNDALIALTCRQHGSVLITSNKKDFELFHPYIDFKVVYW